MAGQDSNDMSLQQIVRLRWGLVECFDSGELATLCNDLNIPYDEIKGEGLEEKARELISYLKRRGRLAELVNFCRDIRPNYMWSQPTEIESTSTTLAEWQRRKQRESELNNYLRSERLPAYKELWACLEPLAKYARPAPFTFKAAANLSESMRNWYFNIGGIYLSERCRKTYFALQETLQNLIDVPLIEEKDDDVLSESDFEFIRQKSSELRATLAEDLGTRR